MHFPAVSKTIVVCSAIATMLTTAHAQLAPGINWKRINATHFDIAVPAELVGKGQETANMLEYLYKEYGITLHTSMHRWTVKINPAMAQFNGFVTSAPRYSEFFLPQLNALGPGTYYEDDILYSLATHETRHMAQFDKELSGCNLFWYILGGDWLLMAMGYVNGMPNWYYEGDATLFETEYSTTGRGRAPAFSLLTKARLLDGKPLTYYQSLHPSYVKPEAGDPYIAGYNLITAMRRKYGTEIMGTIVDRKNGFSGQLPLGFRRAVRKVTHTSILSIHRESNDSMRAAYRSQVDHIAITPARTLFKPSKHDFTMYGAPHWVDSQTLIYRLSSLNRVSRIEKATLAGTRSTVLKRLQMFSPFSYHDSTIVYTALQRNPRFENEYSDIYRYTTTTRQFTRLSSDKRYYTPVFDARGKRIALLSLDSAGRSGVKILNTETGAIEKSLLIPELHVASNPVWGSNTGEIIFIINGPHGYGIARWDSDSSTYTMLLDYQKDFMTGLSRCGYWLLYTSPCSGIDNIFAFDSRDRRRYQITSRKYSATLPQVSPDGKWIAYLDFTGPSGNTIAVAPFDTSAWIPRDSVREQPVRLYDTTTDTKPRYSLAQFSSINQTAFPIDDYPVAKNLFNVHSWKLLADPFFFVDGSSLLGLSLSSNSIFKDVGWVLDANYQPGIDGASAGPYVMYHGWWPRLALGAAYSRNNVFAKTDPFSSDLTGIAGIELPLTFTLNRSIVQSSTGIDAIPQIGLSRSGAHLPQTTELLTNYYSGIGWYFEAPATNINGFYGVTINMSYASAYSMYGSTGADGHFLAQCNTAFPAFFGRDNFNFGISYTSDDNFNPGMYSPYLLAPIGIDSIRAAHRRTTGTASYSVPLWHPDFALGPVLFFNRIGMTLFGEGTINLDDRNATVQQTAAKAWSAGVALFTDVELFSAANLPVRIGVHTEYVSDETGNTYQNIGLVFNTPFSGIPTGKYRSDTRRTSADKWRRTLRCGYRSGF